MRELAWLWIILGVIFLGTVLGLEVVMIVVVNEALFSTLSVYKYEISFKWLVGVTVGTGGLITFFTSTFVVYLCRVTIDCQLSDLGPFQRAKFIGLLQQKDFDEGKITPIKDAEDRENFGRKK